MKLNLNKKEYNNPHLNGNNTNYQKFIILGIGRCGSNYLISLLRSNNEILAHTEPFVKKKGEIFWGYEGYPDPYSEEVLSFRDKYPLNFLDRMIFRQYSNKIKAVGLKVFYDQAQEKNWNCIWDYLKKQNIKIIHIKRKNKLKMLLSLRLASLTGKWTSLDKNKIKINPVKLNYKECLDFFKKTEKYEGDYDTFFNDHKKIEVIYEDLAKDPVKETDKIQEFLGVEVKNLTTDLKKQNKLPLSKSIENYWELKEKFKNTEWGEFFEE